MAPAAPALLVLIALLPLIALLSGMAMTPALLLLAVLMARSAHKAGVLRPLWSIETRGLALIVALLLAWPLLSGIWSIAPERSFTSAVRVIVLMAFGAGAFVLAGRLPPLPERAVFWFAGCIAFCAGLMALELLPGGGILRRAFDALGLDYTRFIIKNVNRGLCALAVLVWPAVAALYAAGRKGLALLLPVLLAVPMFAFESLSAQVGLVAGFAVFCLLLPWPKAMTKMLAVVVPLFFTAWPVIFPVLDAAVLSKPSVYEKLPGSAQHRVEIWRFAEEKTAERPALGWGFESSRHIPGGDVAYSGERKYLPMHPHNSALQILLEQGAIGFLLSCAALSIVMWRWSRLESIGAAARATSGAAIVAYLTIGFSAFGMWQYWWLAVGWLAAVLWSMNERSLKRN